MLEKPVLFVSFRPLERAENLRAIYNAYAGAKVHKTIYDDDYESEIRSGKYDVMVIDEFPRIATKKCIMIWHGIQGGKCIGLDQPYPYYKASDAKLMTYVITPGTGTVGIFAGCTGVPKENVLPLGMPRTDDYIGKRKGSGDTILSIKRTYLRSYLYVPTFREAHETQLPDVDWKLIDEMLTDRELLAVKSHPVTKTLNLNQYRHIIEIPGSEPSAPYLYDCDVVITDYSSIMFDAFLLRKPVVLFEKNKGYTESRGMYFRYPDEYCSRYATNETDLIRLVRSVKRLGKVERNCMKVVADMCDGHSCERICKLIDDMKGEDT